MAQHCQCSVLKSSFFDVTSATTCTKRSLLSPDVQFFMYPSFQSKFVWNHLTCNETCLLSPYRKKLPPSDSCVVDDTAVLAALLWDYDGRYADHPGREFQFDLSQALRRRWTLFFSHHARPLSKVERLLYITQEKETENLVESRIPTSAVREVSPVFLLSHGRHVYTSHL